MTSFLPGRCFTGPADFNSQLAHWLVQRLAARDKPFGRWGEVFGDDVVAAAMIDRLVHHAEVISLKGDSYRLNTGRTLTRRGPSEI